MNDCIVVLNCGSSSIKFALFDATAHPLPRAPMWSGKVEGIGTEHPTAAETVRSRTMPRSCTFAGVSSTGWTAAG